MLTGGDPGHKKHIRDPCFGSTREVEEQAFRVDSEGYEML